MIAPNLIELGHINIDRLQRMQTIYKHWYPELIDQTIEGLLYSDHLVDNRSTLLVILEVVAFLSVIIAMTSALFAYRSKLKTSLMTQKYQSTSQKLESFQDVIMNRLDTTRTNEDDIITYVSPSLAQNLQYHEEDMLARSKPNKVLCSEQSC